MCINDSKYIFVLIKAEKFDFLFHSKLEQLTNPVQSLRLVHGFQLLFILGVTHYGFYCGKFRVGDEQGVRRYNEGCWNK